MCYFIPYSIRRFSYNKIKKYIYFLTQICLFSSFAFRFLFANYFFALSLLIRGTVKVERLGMTMKEGRLRWYGHVMRRNQTKTRRKMMEMELTGKKKRGRPKKRFLDVVKKYMGEVGAKETDVENRTAWRKTIRCGYP